jgi:hypothetical protein
MNYSSNFAQFVASSDAPKFPLGINTEFAANFEVKGEFGDPVACRLNHKTGALVPVDRSELDLRRVRYRLQRVAHNVLGYKHRIGYCHRHLGHDSVGAHVRNVGGRHSLGGLAVCGGAWVCPVCATRIARRRAGEVRELILKAQSDGLVVEMVTLTVPHGLGDSAKFLSDSVAAAWRSITCNGAWKRPGGPRSLPGIKKRAGVHGYVRALEVTHGSNGWHPHLHIIFISDHGLMVHRCRIWELWANACVSLGLGQPSLDRGIDIQDGEKAGEYLCKFSDDGELLQTRQGQGIKWDAADELTLANKKSGRNGSRKPHQILADAEYDYKAVLLFREFAAAFKGKSQLQWTRGLKDYAGVAEKTDEELAETESQTDLVMVIPPAYWAQLIKTSAAGDRRSTLIRLSETGSLEAVALYLVPIVHQEYQKILDSICALTYYVMHPES